jgi:hypothetical protein
MSHPNPYLFQINRWVLQASSWVDISVSARSYPLQDDMDFKDAFTMFWTLMIVFIIENFNVSSTKDSKHAKLSRYV